MWAFSLSTSQKLPELPRSLRSPLEDILRSVLQHKMMAAAGETAETDRGKGQNITTISEWVQNGICFAAPLEPEVKIRRYCW